MKQSPVPKLSVILITQNEAQSVQRCLESVKWADEIIIVDSGSVDNTLSICQAYTSHITITSDWPGFGPQKNRALARATGQWVLSLDADEEVTPLLAQEIREALMQNIYDAYRIQRISTYCGKFIRYGDWRSDQPIRLFQREKGRFTEEPVHESLQVTGKVGTLKTPMRHFSYATLHQVLEKLNRYTSISAEEKFRQGQTSSLLGAILRGGFCFFRAYILKRGFLDGREGFLLAFSSALSVFYRCMKLVYLKEQSVCQK